MFPLLEALAMFNKWTLEFIDYIYSQLWHLADVYLHCVHYVYTRLMSVRFLLTMLRYD